MDKTDRIEKVCTKCGTEMWLMHKKKWKGKYLKQVTPEGNISCGSYGHNWVTLEEYAKLEAKHERNRSR